MRIHPKNTEEKLGYLTIKDAAASYLRTPMGHEEMDALQPHGFGQWVQRALARTGEMMHLLSHDEGFPLEELVDVSDALQKAGMVGGWLPPEWMLAIGAYATSARRLKQFIRQREEQFPELFEISTRLSVLKEFEDEIKRVLTEQGAVRDSASAELQTIRRQLQSRKSDVRRALQNVIRKAHKNGFMDEQDATMRNGRMVIPIKAEHKRKISGFVHDVSATGQTVYLEPAEVLHINNDIRELESREYREIERILTALTAMVRSFLEPLRLNAEAIGELDLLHAKAKLGLEMDAIMPKISESGHLRLEAIKNPVLLLKSRNSGEPVVPLTLHLSAEEQGLIITGPNAGGKSVAMKTTGLCCMMALSGFALPSESACDIPLLDGLFMDMGDEQSIENDLSTFSSRLQWMKTCLEEATSTSLILIDEAGSGTDPEEGTALYQALITKLTEVGARLIVTTHHGALKVFAHEHPRWVNGSMAFDQQALSPTYVFEKGVPGSSYAFDIARRLGVPDEVTAGARSLLGSSKNTMEQLITELQQRRFEADQLRISLLKKERNFEQQRKEFEQKNDKINRERDEIRQNALNEAQKIIQDANKRVEEAIKTIVATAADKETVKSIKKTLAEDGQALSKEMATIQERKKARTSTEPPKLGDEVAMIDTHTSGELIEKKGNQAVVLMNGLRVKTKYSNLVKVAVSAAKKTKKVRLASSGSSVVVPASYSLDLRGNRGEEAIPKVTRFLDNALSRGLHQVEIIHGKGEGILRKLIHEYLAMRKDIVSFEIAPLQQGGHGCTLVYLA